MVKAGSCKNDHLLTPHWFGRILLCYAALWIPKEMVSKWLCETGRQHGACSETFWASCIMLFVFPGKDGRVTGRTESHPESQMDYAHFLPPLAQLSPSLFYAIRWKQPTSLMWPFPVCGMRTKELCFLSMLLPSLSPTLSMFILPSLSNLSLYLSFISQF